MSRIMHEDFGGPSATSGLGEKQTAFSFLHDGCGRSVKRASSRRCKLTVKATNHPCKWPVSHCCLLEFSFLRCLAGEVQKNTRAQFILSSSSLFFMSSPLSVSYRFFVGDGPLPLNKPPGSNKYGICTQTTCLPVLVVTPSAKAQ